MPRQTHQFNLRLDDSTRDMLTKLATKRGVCAAHLIRELIQNRYTMLNSNIPICSDGNGCIMAGMWIQNKGALLQVQQGQLSDLDETKEPPAKLAAIA